MKKIDIHCHVLPEVDDGAASMEESLKMLRMAERQGIGKVIATPHFSPAFPNNNPEKLWRLCKEVENKIKRELDKDFTVYLGQEIFYADGIFKKLEKRELLTMAGSNYILLEFEWNIPYSSIYRVVREAIIEGYRPILAHVERYHVLREKGRIEELKKAGAYIQINYGALCGKWYEERTRWCKRQLKAGNVHFLATDMHNCRERKPRTAEAQEWLLKNLPEQYRERLLYKNAEFILENIKI